jgi:hypothetical protein
MEDTMSRTTVIRYETKADAADENQRLVQQVFAELDKEQPEGLRYASFRLDDGVTFVHIVESDGDSDPLPQLAAFQAFQSTMGQRIASPPVRGGAEVIGSYNFFSK